MQNKERSIAIGVVTFSYPYTHALLDQGYMTWLLHGSFLLA